MSTVFITGLSGYIAFHTASLFLKKGWSVRGTVRTVEKGEAVLAHPLFVEYKGKVDYVLVPDIAIGDFSQGLDNVDAVIHAASPVYFNGTTWKEYRDPAVQGTTRILEQAAKVSSVKAFAVISSFVAVGDTLKPYDKHEDEPVYTEKDWFPYEEEFALQMEKEKAPHAPFVFYHLSKKYAEKAAYEIHEKSKPSFSLGVVCPPFVIGPAYHATTAESIYTGGVASAVYAKTLIGGKDSPVPATVFPPWVDVRGVADALFKIIDQKISGRFILFDGFTDNDSVVKEARRLRPDLDAFIPFIEADAATMVHEGPGNFRIDASKADRELGVQHYTLSQTIGDTLAQYETLGAFKAAGIR